MPNRIETASSQAVLRTAPAPATVPGSPGDSAVAFGNAPASAAVTPGAAPRAQDGRLPAMEVRDVAFAYGKNRVLGGVCMLVEQGKVTTVMGPNGCGKSTLFALMTKNLQPDRGKVFLRGRNIAAMGLKDFARQVSIVHQNNTAADDMTVEQLVELGRAPYRKPMTDLGAEDAQLVDWALQVTGTDAYRDRELVRLSGGQRQRVWIAMALAQNTRILFLDEPTTYLDVRYQIEILDLVRRLNREFGMTIVMVLHDINQAIAYSDVVVGLKDGAVSFAGDPNDLVTHESMRDLYGVDLEVMETRGVKHVLLQGPDARNAALAGAPQGPAPGHDGQTPLQAAFAPSISNAPADALAEGNPGVAGAGALPETATTGKPADSAGPGEAAGPLRPVPAWAPDYARAEAQRDAGTGASGLSAGAAAQPADGVPTRDEPARSKNRIARALWTALGVVAFGLGTAGTVLPFLPTVPLYLAALFCFAKGSQRLHDWFVNTDLYHKHLADFVDHRGMTMRTKLSIMGMVTLVMGVAFALMGRVPVARVILVVVWVAHVVYFMGFVKTERSNESDDDADEAAAADAAHDAAVRQVPAWAQGLVQVGGADCEKDASTDSGKGGSLHHGSPDGKGAGV